MVSPALDAALLVSPPVLALSATATASGVRYLMADGNRQASARLAWRIRRAWKRTAVMVGLVQTTESAKLGEQIPLNEELRAWTRKPRHLTPKLRVYTDDYGVTIRVKTLGRLGLKEWRNASSYLADAWRVPRVQVSPGKPGWLVVRAMLRDPLTEVYTLPARPIPVASENPVPADVVDLRTWRLGRGEDGSTVSVRSHSVPGVVVSGQPGYGKSSLLLGRVADLAFSPCVQFVVLDGKGGGDWDDFAPRCWRFCKANREMANKILGEVWDLMNRRHDLIRALLGVKDLWRIGPSVEWPMIQVIIDEAHTFFHFYKGDKPGEALAAQAVKAVEDLIRMGRDVGIQVILATQKPTGDAIPTSLRDNCPIAISFAQRTSEAAVAALGSDINDYPHAHPRRLQDPAYVGVATLVAQGRPGFTLVRTPLGPDEDQMAQIAAATAHLVTDPTTALDVDLAA